MRMRRIGKFLEYIWYNCVMVSSTRTEDMAKIIKKMKAQGQIDQLKLQLKEQNQKMVRIKNERDYLKTENERLLAEIAKKQD